MRWSRLAVLAVACAISGCMETGPSPLEEATASCASIGVTSAHPRFRRCLELYAVASDYVDATTPRPQAAPAPAETVVRVELPQPRPVTCVRGPVATVCH
jgi:hypothetical protein